MFKQHNIKDVLHDFLADNFSSYVTILPHGLRLESGKLIQRISGQIMHSGPARTLYENRKPSCRSLNGVQSLQSKTSCAACYRRGECTPQIRLDLLHASGIHRFLLAYTSARKYMLFLSSLAKQQCPVEGAEITISVINRGKWGELCFRQQSREKEA